MEIVHARRAYLYFNGRCEEAVELYRRAVGAEVVTLRRNNENPGAPAGTEDKVMHANLRIGDTTVLASDGQSQGPANFQGFSLSLTVSKDVDADRLFDALADGGAKP